VIGAALPVLFSLITRGLPRYLQLIGFLLAFLGIWLVSRSTGDATSNSRKGFLLGILAGFGFGGFFILISQVGTEKVFTPLIISRSVMFVTSLFLIKVNHMSFPSIIKTPVALLAGVLDAGGNILFMLAKQLTRLDTAVVISSLYPAGTVILAGILLKEKISTWQKIGVVICLIAIVLITI
jgi:drug/metabolite transporter (DMT)-like permease